MSIVNIYGLKRSSDGEAVNLVGAYKVIDAVLEVCCSSCDCGKRKYKTTDKMWWKQLVKGWRSKRDRVRQRGIAKRKKTT